MFVMALILAVDAAVIWSKLLSAMVSSGCGSAVVLQDNASGVLFRIPFSQVAVNV